MASVSEQEVRNVIWGNNAVRAAEILEDFGLAAGGNPPCFTSGNRDLALAIITLCSISARKGNLDEALAEEVIGRTAMTIDIFEFIKTVLMDAELKDDDEISIPGGIIDSFSEDGYSSTVARAIERLDDDQFKELIIYLASSEVESLHVKYNVGLLKRIYKISIVPDNLFFAYMGLNMRKTREECAVDDALDFFGDLISGIREQSE